MLTAALLVALLTASPAHAGACCVGSTSVVPARLGECERWVLGLSTVAQRSVGRWDSSGQLSPSSLQDDSLTTELIGGWRWNRKAQLGLSVPTLINRKDLGEEPIWGSGLGDVRLSGLWDPLNELPRGVEGVRAWPVPIFQVGLRLPTGRTWEEAEGALFEDVTGRPGTGLILAAGLERTLDRTPWSLNLGGELAPDGEHLHSVLGLDASLGRTLGRRFSVSARASHQQTRVHGEDSGATRRSSVGISAVHGVPLRTRSWLALDADLPVPGLGQNNLRAVRAGVGVAVLR